MVSSFEVLLSSALTIIVNWEKLKDVLKVLIYEIFLKTSYEEKKKTIIILEHMGLFTTKSTPHPSLRH